jgi:hypothetical protein
MLLVRTTAIFACLVLLSGCTTRTKENLSFDNNWTTQQKVNGLTVGISIQPPTAQHNAVFITLRNKAGEPIVGANVAITSLKQFLFSTDKNLKSRYVAPGTYRIDTDMPEGISEMNIAVTPHNLGTTNLRIEATIQKSMSPTQGFMPLQ